ncbi:MAG: DCC1-like thiol-disulfide oxidoreductase family protein [Bacteroidota bacterium]
MNKVTNFLRNSYKKSIDGTGLAVFRILYSLVLLCEIAQMFYFKELIFDKIPFIDKAEINFGIPIAIWFISVLLILFGLFTRFSAIINYLLSLILIGTITSYEYHVFYAYMGVNFLLMFLPVSKCLSLDRLLLKLKYSNTTFQYNPPRNVSQLYYFLPLYVAVGLVYFDSIFVKLTAHSWLSGLGVWMPASFPMMAQFNLSFLLNLKYLDYFLGYLTLLLELIFIFVFFRKKFRIPVFIVGIFLHIGILICFPIPWFALTLCSLYFLLIPVSFWKKFFKSKNTKQDFFFYYDTECPLCIRTKITITHLDWFNKIGFKTVQFDAQDQEKLAKIDQEILLNDIHSVDAKGNVYAGVDTYIQVFKRIFYLFPLYLLLKVPGIYHLAKNIYAYVAKNRDTERCTEDNCGYNPPSIPDNEKIKILQNYTLDNLKFDVLKSIIYFFSIIQIIIILDSPLINNFKKTVGINNRYIDFAFYGLKKATIFVAKPLFGLTQHNVFIDKFHYDGYNHIIAIVYLDKKGQETWLPIIDKNGQPSYYNYGTNWRKMSFSTNNPNIDPNHLNSGVRDFSAFWAHKNNISLKDATFIIKVKKIDSTNKWEKDFLNKQIAKPWIDGGYVKWHENKFQPYIKNIEAL